ncbi:c-type cytochrome [Methylomicrobium lacus]|uniref:c-type cytochrome n=1 Tax=Methylomicrobium lacus TaxID=136992 RepID=UPI00045E717A|nr:c-type cytochrome [Methylomicrobium lacus]
MGSRFLTSRAGKFGVSLLLIISMAFSGYWAMQFYGMYKNSSQLSFGERIYNQGLDSSGSPLQGRTEGDIDFKDANFNCAQCHRRSGYGSSEGGNYVLPITGASLFNPRSFDRADLFKKLFKESQSKLFWARMRSAYQRPAYTEESLAKAIRKGIDPSGRTLNPLMPRYQISDRDMSGLIAYLKNLSSQNDPGIDNQSIYFATVVGKGVDADSKNAMLSTITKFVEWLNLETKGNQDHPNFSPNYRSDFAKAFRLWQHDIWELSENPADWPKELQAYYDKKPVFALIGGMAPGDWTPIHRFCEQNHLPCLFPITELPAQEQSGHYSIYFNAGLALEAQAIAKYLSKEIKGDTTDSIVQIYRDEEAQGQIPANIFNAAMSAESPLKSEKISYKKIEDFRQAWSEYKQNHSHIRSLVIWPDKLGTEVLTELALQPEAIERIFLPSGMLQKDLSTFSKDFIAKLIFAYPYELPTAYHPHAFRVRAWMNTRRLPITNDRIQFNSYYALNLLQYSLEHVVDHFSRDYLLEYIEHEAENALNPGTFPRLSLGPEQRFASKGAYLVQLGSNRSIIPISDWIVP